MPWLGAQQPCWRVSIVNVINRLLLLRSRADMVAMVVRGDEEDEEEEEVEEKEGLAWWRGEEAEGHRL